MKKLILLLLFIPLVSCDDSKKADKESKQSPIYKDKNGIIKCENCEVGFVGEIDGVSYKVVDYKMLKTMVENNEDLRFICTSKVTNMFGMFYGLKFNGDISNWDVSNVASMMGMFATSNFNGDISNWDVSNVTDMSRMFFQSYFNGDISNWDVSNVENMVDMFYDSKVPLKFRPKFN